MNKDLLHILDNLFQECLSDPDGVDTALFEVKHEDHLDQIEWLHRKSYIDKTNHHTYQIKLISILKLGDVNPEAKKLIHLCDKIYTAFGNIYRKNPKASVSLNKLAKSLNVPRWELNFALTHMETTHAIQGRSTGFPDNEDEEVTLSSELLRYKTFKDQVGRLLELQENLDNRDYVSPVDYSILDEHLGETPIGFEELLHPKIIESSVKQYRSGNYRGAALDSIIAVFDLIREKTGLEEDGDKLVGRAFKLADPYLIVSELDTESGQNDQKGFIQLLNGVYQGVRNRKAHTLKHDLTRKNAAQYLVYSSLLAQRIEDAQLVKNTKNSTDEI